MCIRYRCIFLQKADGDATLADVLRPGKEMVAAGYALYGSATMVVLTTGDGVNGFTLDPVRHGLPPLHVLFI